jgi:hypothetical protein
MLLRRPPAFEKIVLERGDEWAAHTGSTGGLQMGATVVQPPDTGNVSPRDHGWLGAHGIAWRHDDTA